MNIGLLLSLFSGFIWSIGNAIDKVSVTKLIKSPIALLYIFIIMTLVAGVVVLPFTVHSLSGQDILRFCGLSIFYMLGTLLYFLALQREEPSRVVPLYSLVVLFLSVFSAIFLGEVFNIYTYLAIGLLIIGTIGISSRGNPVSAFRSRALGIMIISSLCYAMAYVIMKSLLKSYTPWDVFSYQRVFTGMLGLLALPFLLNHLRSIYKGIAKKRFLAWSFLSMFFGELGALLFVIASSLWFITLVETVVNIQFVFIFLLGWLVTRLWPQLYTEAVDRRTVVRKIISICLIIGGIVIISI